jgi:5-(carboxyamino)imidazole ribonucleotide synthase
MKPFDLGLLGGGQLARMSIMAAQRMGLRCLSLEQGVDTPASQVAPFLDGSIYAAEDLARLLEKCERATLENEFIPADTLAKAMEMSGFDPAFLTPSVETLAAIQDKLAQRRAYRSYGAPSPLAVPASEGEAAFGYPHMLKARFGGYDGKGTRRAGSREERDAVLSAVDSSLWLAEELVPFRRELAVMVCRSRSETLCFPTMETLQTRHVCDLVFPSGVDASGIAVAAVEAVQGFGLFGVELFELEEGALLINELAPRPHNSGHYTQDWGGVSQFEQHVRLTMGFPLAPITGGEACMANILGAGSTGDWRKGREAAMRAEPSAFFHWYGKADMREGRKMGHINAAGPGARKRAERARRAFFEAVKE